ncbi:MAG: RNA-binding protein [Anaerolineae bacterium]|nr:RNA-binding protein [Anaerolineae bacterium]
MNIYVGNLPFTTNEDELRKTFAAFGEVTSAAVIKDQFTGQSRGFGFIEMPNKEEGEAAINGLNGKDFKGRPLKVNEARPREERRGPGGPGGGSSGGPRRGPGGFGGGDRRGGSGGGQRRDC